MKSILGKKKPAFKKKIKKEGKRKAQGLYLMRI